MTSAEAFRKLGATRLSAIIFSLKKDGYKIVTSRECGTNRYGKTVYFAQYKLIGEEGHEQI